METIESEHEASTPTTVAGAAGIAALVAGREEAVRARVLDRLRRWVERETPTGDEAGIVALAEEVAEVLGAAGAEIERLDVPGVGRHLRARVPGIEPELAPVLVLAHIDTVHPAGTVVTRPFRVVDGRAEGPGSYDMKAGLAVLTEALLLLVESGTGPRRPVRILVTCDEETGSDTSRPLIEQAAQGAAAALVLEPPLADGAAKTARKGVGAYRLHVRGRAAHAGIEPERGVSAAIELAHQLLRIAALAEPDRGTTINIGRIAGGTASNVVPAAAWADVDVRFATAAEGERLDAALRTLGPVHNAAALTLTGGINRPPLERSDGVLRLYRHARTLAEALGFELPEGATGGASDGCFTAALGVPTLDGLGVRGGGAHSEDEHILVADLVPRVSLLGRLLETL